MAYGTDPRDPTDPTLTPQPPAPPANPAPSAPSAPSGGYSLTGNPTDQFINAFYPGYKAVNGQFVYTGTPGNVGGLGGGSIIEPSGAADYINKLWDPYSKGDYENFFKLFRADATASTDTLGSYAPILGQLGWKFNKNAAGKYTDFTLPNGQIIDPLFAANDPSRSAWQWMQGGGGPGAGSFGGAFGEPFTPPSNQPMPGAPQFSVPTLGDMLKDPGYQFRTSEGIRALEQSAAARGVENTGGTLKDVLNYGQGAASQEYGAMFNRAMDVFNTKLGPWQTQVGWTQHANDQQWQQAWQKWVEDYEQWRNQQNDTFNHGYLLSQ